MENIHDNDVNSISQCNTLHDILNPSNGVNNTNSSYSAILNGFMNTRRGKVKYKAFKFY